MCEISLEYMVSLHVCVVYSFSELLYILSHDIFSIKYNNLTLGLSELHTCWGYFWGEGVAYLVIKR